ncbi:hypothetical protein J4Q44_G00280220 [Coregonus suidteri]|uniref:Uncharacterized protein n=1 Tax=Coregonus suidteri TaxID=861788 RepID=A0AAN8QE60_9TELE
MPWRVRMTGENEDNWEFRRGSQFRSDPLDWAGNLASRQVPNGDNICLFPEVTATSSVTNKLPWRCQVNRAGSRDFIVWHQNGVRTRPPSLCLR